MIHAMTWVTLENMLSGKAVTKYHILYDSIYTNYKNGQTDRDREYIARAGKDEIKGWQLQDVGGAPVSGKEIF